MSVWSRLPCPMPADGPLGWLAGWLVYPLIVVEGWWFGSRRGIRRTRAFIEAMTKEE